MKTNIKEIPKGAIPGALSPDDIAELGIFMTRNGRIVEVFEVNHFAFCVRGRILKSEPKIDTDLLFTWTRYGGFHPDAVNVKNYLDGKCNDNMDIKWRVDPEVYPEYLI